MYNPFKRLLGRKTYTIKPYKNYGFIVTRFNWYELSVEVLNRRLRWSSSSSICEDSEVFLSQTDAIEKLCDYIRSNARKILFNRKQKLATKQFKATHKPIKGPPFVKG